MTTDERLDRLEALIMERFDKTDSQFRDLRSYLLEMRSETIQRFDQLDARVELNYSSISQRVNHEQVAHAYGLQDLNRRMNALEEKIAKLVPPAA